MEHEIAISGITSALFLGLIIGLRHSTDGDHVVAVSTMARDYKSVFRGLWVGVSWGLGHSTPLLLLGILILLVKQSIMDFYDSVATFFEFGVALMLIFLGAQVFWKMYMGHFHTHDHEHDGEEHKHLHGSHGPEDNLDSPHELRTHGPFPELIPFFRLKSYAIGVVHGLAGSAVVLLAVLAATPDILSGILFLICFSLGTMISMALMTIVLSIPFVATQNSNTFANTVISLAGVLSIVLGLALGSDIVLGTNMTSILWY
tara:strand:- start:156 stop:932 length:777 start_codon:yes stop_codon:yes gene_type:complete